jgi:membrane protein DedA with SNARE-associated domain
LPGWLPELAAAPTAYLIVGALVTADVFFPLIPGEAAVIAAGVLAAQGELSGWAVVATATIAAALGDNGVYWTARTVGARRPVPVGGHRRIRELTRTARTELERRRVQIILTARFIPGGRTATSLAAGSIAMPWRRFVTVDAAAALLWASYTTMLGVLGGSAFSDSLWKPLVASLSFAALVGLATELVRRRRERGGSARGSAP